MRLIRSAIMRYHATSTSICNASSRRAEAASRVDVEPKLDIARYHMIEVQINLMNFLAVTIFLARVVARWCLSPHWALLLGVPLSSPLCTAHYVGVQTECRWSVVVKIHIYKSGVIQREKNSFVGNAYSQYLYLIGADDATNAEMVAVYIVFSYYISENLKMWWARWFDPRRNFHYQLCPRKTFLLLYPCFTAELESRAWAFLRFVALKCFIFP